MASFVIEGGHKLHGEIHPQGAKNEVLQILCATLLTWISHVGWSVGCPFWKGFDFKTGR